MLYKIGPVEYISIQFREQKTVESSVQLAGNMETVKTGCLSVFFVFWIDFQTGFLRAYNENYRIITKLVLQFGSRFDTSTSNLLTIFAISI